MPERQRQDTAEPDADSDAAIATEEQAADQEPKLLPPYKVLLHNDDVNEFGFVIAAILKLTPLNFEQACERTLEAHETGVALLLVTHKERAELYREQFQTFHLTVTIEPDEV
jgi:ATP-dependent Clp protease adaptor protein ClpS